MEKMVTEKMNVIIKSGLKIILLELIDCNYEFEMFKSNGDGTLIIVYNMFKLWYDRDGKFDYIELI